MSPHVLQYHLLLVVCIAWPAWVICRRSGAPVWALALLAVPIFGVTLFFTALAFTRWPQKQV